MSEPERVLCCGTTSQLSTLYHATRSIRIRDAIGAATNHHSSLVAMCGENVKQLFPFLPALKTIQTKGTRFCSECAERVLQETIDDATMKQARQRR